jgi:hypothetical protein
MHFKTWRIIYTIHERKNATIMCIILAPTEIQFFKFLKRRYITTYSYIELDSFDFCTIMSRRRDVCEHPVKHN